MSTPYLLVCVEKPKWNDATQKYEGEPSWFSFVEEMSKLGMTFSTAERPVENMWLLPVYDALLRASKMIALCDRLHTSYKLFYLENEPRKCS